MSICADDLLVWPQLREELAPFLQYCTGIVLNAGSGQRDIKLGERELNLDVIPSTRPHVIGDVHNLPLLDESVDTVVSIAVLEHTRHPWTVAQEFFRVLRPTGMGVIAVPFLQPQHACPNDFVRFTEAGLIELMKFAGFEVVATSHVHHFGQTLAWMVAKYLEHNQPSRLTEPLWAAFVRRLSTGRLLRGDSPDTHNTHYVVARKPGESASPRPHYVEALAREDAAEWFYPLLACPQTKQRVRLSQGAFVSEDGVCSYGFTDGIPTLIPPPGASSRLVVGEKAAAVVRTEASQIACQEDLGVTFKPAVFMRLRRARAQKVAFLVTSEYEGIFRNGGVGTHYRTLSEQLTADGWYVILLLTHSADNVVGEGRLAWVKQVFLTRQVEQLLSLGPLHRATLSNRGQNAYDDESFRCLLFAQAVADCFRGVPVYVEFPDMMGAAYQVIHAKRAGLLGANCVIGLTMHSGHEWVFEANGKHGHENPSGMWRAAYYESFSFESADLVFYPSRFLRGKVEGYGWGTGHAVHMPYFVPVLDGGGARREDLPAVEVGRIPVVFFGRLEERKGLCTFVEALQSLGPEVCQGLHVLFVGKVVPLYSAPLRHLDSRQYLEGALGREVTFSIVADLYSEEALRYVGGLKNPVVCLTSPQENFPNSALEMGQLAVNLVVSDTGGFRETLELVQRAAGVYWFEPKNPRALAGAIARAIADGLEEPQVMDRQEVRRLNEALLTRKLQHIHEAFARAPGVAAGQPRVTVGVIWDDQHTALIECLGSLEGQSYGDFEVIILDNACTTRPARDTFEQARALFPQYRFVRSRALSAGAARNHLVELAEGAFFLGLDPDGILLPFAIEQFVKAARQSAAVLVACPRREGPSGQVTGFPEGPLPSLLLSPPPGPACSWPRWRSSATPRIWRTTMGKRGVGNSWRRPWPRGSRWCAIPTRSITGGRWPSRTPRPFDSSGSFNCGRTSPRFRPLAGPRASSTCSSWPHSICRPRCNPTRRHRRMRALLVRVGSRKGRTNSGGRVPSWRGSRPRSMTPGGASRPWRARSSGSFAGSGSG